MLAAPDYKAMYLELFRASEQAARLLQEAQARAEQQLLAADMNDDGRITSADAVALVRLLAGLV